MTSQFGAIVRKLRLRAGMTQEDLAERAGLGVRTVRGLETGERADPRMETMRRLADAFVLDEADRTELFAAAGFTTRDHESPAPQDNSRTRSVVDDRLTEAADELGHAMRARWQREEEQRQIHDPFPLPVRWRPVPEELTDSWANIRRAPAGVSPEPLDLTGSLDQVVEVYRRIPSGRLVVLGDAGSGKTVLTVRFVLDLLRTRVADEPVPVVFSLGSWNPTTTNLRDWLIAQLRRDHPGLDAPGADGSTLAAALVETDRVLPVLDGFDEIADGLHRAALEALNATRLPLLLTSRPDEYAAAVAGNDVLTAAGGVRLTGLTVTDLADYLPRTTRRTGEGTAWQPVLSALHEQAGADLAAVLTTPLMVGLARVIYSDTPHHDPADLLDRARFPTPKAIEEHLLGNLVPTAYRDQPENGRFHPDHVERWLGYLARHLHRLGTYDLAWWQLGTSMRLPVRMLVVALTTGLVLGFADLVVESLVAGFNVYRIVFGSALGCVAGFTFGAAHGLLNRPGHGGVEPSRVRLRLRTRPGSRTPGNVIARVKIGFVAGLLLGLAFGLVREMARGLMLGQWQGPVFTLVDSTVFGLAFGLAAALMSAVIARCETPLDVKSASSPLDLLHANRRTVLIQLLVFGPVFALVVPLVSWLLVVLLQLLPPTHGIEFTWTAQFGLLLGLVGGLVGGLGYALCMTAWGQWVVFARICLPLTGRLPWAVRAFLDDAYRRGVLRRAGAVYQFRHARLQDHLADRSR